jgi:predicted porin
MKKTLLAAALMAGFAGVAQAETSVTLYGIIDTGIGYQQIKGSDAKGNDFKFSKTGLINGVQSGSRWGLKGAEDLGNGLRAVFVLESGFDSSTGDSAQGGRLFGRQLTVGLASDSWGQIDLGRQTNIASKYFGDIASPFGASFGQANVGATFGSANTARWDNMIMYQTPNFSGFQFGVGYSFNINGSQSFKESGENDPNTRGITTGIRYANGPIAAALTYDQVKTDAVTAEDGTASKTLFTSPDGTGNIYSAPVKAKDSVTIKQWNLGASYDFEVVKLHAGFGQTRDGWIQPQGYGNDVTSDALKGVASKGFKANLYTLGVSAPLGAGKVMASWAMADPKGDADGAEKQNIYSLGYTYSLSKRTNVYAYGSYAKNVYFADDLKSQIIGVGVRHQF